MHITNHIKNRADNRAHSENKNSNALPYPISSIEECLGEFKDDDFDLSQKTPEEPIRHWRPGSSDDKPYE